MGSKMTANEKENILESSLFDAGDGHALIELIRRKRGKQIQPVRVFDDEISSDRKSLNVQIVNTKKPAPTPAVEVVEVNSSPLLDPQSPPPRISPARSPVRKSPLRSIHRSPVSPVGIATKRLTKSLGRRTLLKEFQKTLDKEALFHPQVCSTPLDSNKPLDNFRFGDSAISNICVSPIPETGEKNIEQRATVTQNCQPVAKEAPDMGIGPSAESDPQPIQDNEKSVSKIASRNNGRSDPPKSPIGEGLPNNDTASKTLVPDKTLLSKTSTEVPHTPSISVRKDLSERAEAAVCSPSKTTEPQAVKVRTSKSVQVRVINNGVENAIESCNDEPSAVIVIPIHQTFNQGRPENELGSRTTRRSASQPITTQTQNQPAERNATPIIENQPAEHNATQITDDEEILTDDDCDRDNNRSLNRGKKRSSGVPLDLRLRRYSNLRPKKSLSLNASAKKPKKQLVTALRSSPLLHKTIRKYEKRSDSPILNKIATDLKRIRASLDDDIAEAENVVTMDKSQKTVQNNSRAEITAVLEVPRPYSTFSNISKNLQIAALVEDEFLDETDEEKLKKVRLKEKDVEKARIKGRTKKKKENSKELQCYLEASKKALTPRKKKQHTKRTLYSMATSDDELHCSQQQNDSNKNSELNCSRVSLRSHHRGESATNAEAVGQQMATPKPQFKSPIAPAPKAKRDRKKKAESIKLLKEIQNISKQHKETEPNYESESSSSSASSSRTNHQIVPNSNDVEQTNSAWNSVQSPSLHLAEKEQDIPVEPVVTTKKKGRKAKKAKEDIELPVRTLSRQRRPPVAYWLNQDVSANVIKDKYQKIAEDNKTTGKNGVDKKDKTEKVERRGKKKKVVEQEKAKDPEIVDNVGTKNANKNGKKKPPDPEAEVVGHVPKKKNRRRLIEPHPEDSARLSIERAVDDEVLDVASQTVNELFDELNRKGSKKTQRAERQRTKNRKESDTTTKTGDPPPTSENGSVWWHQNCRVWMERIIDSTYNEKCSAQSSDIGNPEDRYVIYDGLRMASTRHMTFEENNGVEYAFYPGQQKSTCGYMRFQPHAEKPQCRAKKWNIHLLVLQGTLTVACNSENTDFSNGDLVIIEIGSRYSIKNNTSELASLMVFSK